MSRELIEVFSELPQTPGTQIRQATVVEWNTATGQNAINVAGTLFYDLSFMNAHDVRYIRPGDSVYVAVVENLGVFILGRLATPASTFATNVIGSQSGKFVYKPTSTDRINNSMSDDPHLALFNFPGSSTWEITFQGYLSGGASDAGDFKFRIIPPSGAEVAYSVVGMVTTVTSGTTGSGEFSHALGDHDTAAPADINIGVSTSFTGFRATGMMVCGPDTNQDMQLKVQWAQLSTNAQYTRLRVYSYLKAERVG